MDPKHPNHAAAVAFVEANRAAGLSASRQAMDEFLVKAPTIDALKQLQKIYDIKLIREFTSKEVNTLASRLQRAFTDGRVLRDGDAQIAANAVLRGEKLGTADLPFFKHKRPQMTHQCGIQRQSAEKSGRLQARSGNASSPIRNHVYDTTRASY